jgi:hypothetical protein
MSSSAIVPAWTTVISEKKNADLTPSVDWRIGNSNYVNLVENLMRWQSSIIRKIRQRLKGQCHEIFDFWFFSCISFLQAYEYTSTAFSKFFKIRGDIRGSRCTTGVNDTGGKWKKSSSRKILIILFGHLWVVKLPYMYINFCLQVRFKVSAAWYCSHYLPPVSTAQGELVAKFAAGVVTLSLLRDSVTRFFASCFFN